MAWNYDTSLTADKDKVRLYIGDTISTIPLLTDEEITAVLTDEGDVLAATVHICRSLSARFGREAELYTDNVRDLKGKQAEHFLTLAERYAAKSSSTAEIVFTGGFDSTGTSTGPFFTRDMHLEGTEVDRSIQ